MDRELYTCVRNFFCLIKEWGDVKIGDFLYKIHGICILGHSCNVRINRCFQTSATVKSLQNQSSNTPMVNYSNVAIF